MTKGKDNKPHIGIYGRRNAGKSSLINCISGQDIAIVSDIAGTTTDPVKKSYEITGFGPVILIDTAGIDDTGELGLKRIGKTLDSIKVIDLAILVFAGQEMDASEEKLISEFNKLDVPFIVVHNKSDIEKLAPEAKTSLESKLGKPVLEFSTKETSGIDPLVQMIRESIPESAMKTPSLVGDLISYGDVVLLITPIDIEAPEGRLILPQVQVIRDILDNDGVAIVLKEKEVDVFLKNNPIKPKLAITDSQIFLKADAMVPRDIPLTGFSVLFARFRGDFETFLRGTPAIGKLKDGDRVLLLESCTHHVSCDDIGRVKIPRWLTNYSGKKLEYDVVAGLSNLPRDIKEYALVIQCGGCMITRRQLINRIKPAIDAGIPVTNYGMAIAWVQGIYERAVAPFTQSGKSSADYL